MVKTLVAMVVLVAGLIAGSGQTAVAQVKVKVGVFPTASSLPYFVAIERGFFKEQNIEPETIRLIGGPPNIAAMISNQIEAAIVLVTIEAMNANLKKPGVPHASFQMLPQRGWITIKKAAVLFSPRADEYAFGELDQRGKSNLASFCTSVYAF